MNICCKRWVSSGCSCTAIAIGWGKTLLCINPMHSEREFVAVAIPPVGKHIRAVANDQQTQSTRLGLCKRGGSLRQMRRHHVKRRTFIRDRNTGLRGIARARKLKVEFNLRIRPARTPMFQDIGKGLVETQIETPDLLLRYSVELPMQR